MQSGKGVWSAAKDPGKFGKALLDEAKGGNHGTDAWAYGTGLRYRSPVGVLRFDFAKGNLVDKWRLHFSVAISL